MCKHCFIISVTLFWPLGSLLFPNVMQVKYAYVHICITEKTTRNNYVSKFFEWVSNLYVCRCAAVYAFLLVPLTILYRGKYRKRRLSYDLECLSMGTWIQPKHALGLSGRSLWLYAPHHLLFVCSLPCHYLLCKLAIHLTTQWFRKSDFHNI